MVTFMLDDLGSPSAVPAVLLFEVPSEDPSPLHIDQFLYCQRGPVKPHLVASVQDQTAADT